MKKIHIYIICFFALLFLVISNLRVFGDENVSVYAVVWGGNVTPKILSTTPNFDPVVIKRNSLQNFSIQINDPDSNSITYTITPSDGSVLPTSWTITDPVNLQAWQAYLNFTYISPNIKVPGWTITITLNDWSWEVITKIINLYVY